MWPAGGGLWELTRQVTDSAARDRGSVRFTCVLCFVRREKSFSDMISASRVFRTYFGLRGDRRVSASSARPPIPAEAEILGRPKSCRHAPACRNRPSWH